MQIQDRRCIDIRDTPNPDEFRLTDFRSQETPEIGGIGEFLASDRGFTCRVCRRASGLALTFRDWSRTARPKCLAAPSCWERGVRSALVCYKLFPLFIDDTHLRADASPDFSGIVVWRRKRTDYLGPTIESGCGALNRYLLIPRRLIFESRVRPGSPSLAAAPAAPVIRP